MRTFHLALECKRISSVAKLADRIDEAASQIGRCTSAGTSKPGGVIAVDVSKLLNTGPNFPSFPTLQDLKGASEHLLGAFKLEQKSKLGSRKEERVLGVYLYCRLAGEGNGRIGAASIHYTLPGESSSFFVSV
jgi:hypothetical protein